MLLVLTTRVLGAWARGRVGREGGGWAGRRQANADALLAAARDARGAARAFYSRAEPPPPLPSAEER